MNEAQFNTLVDALRRIETILLRIEEKTQPVYIYSTPPTTISPPPLVPYTPYPTTTPSWGTITCGASGPGGTCHLNKDHSSMHEYTRVMN